MLDFFGDACPLLLRMGPEGLYILMADLPLPYTGGGVMGDVNFVLWLFISSLANASVTASPMSTWLSSWPSSSKVCLRTTGRCGSPFFER